MDQQTTEVFNQITDIVYTCDFGGFYTFVNTFTSELMGMPANVMVGKHYTECVADEHADDVRAFVEQKSLDELDGTYHEFKIKTGQNNKLWIGQRINVVRDDDGTPSYLLIIGSAISRLKSVEVSLTESEIKLKSIIDSALDAVVVINQDGKITEWNHQAEQIFGWTKQEVTGKRISETIIPDQHVSAHKQGMKNYMATGHGPVLNKRIEIIAKNKEGTIFPVELTIIPNQIGENHFFSAFIRDITERKKNEQALRDSEQRWQMLVDNQPEAVQISKDGKVEYLNPAGLELYDAENMEEIVGTDLLELSADPIKPVFNDRIKELEIGNTVPALEFNIQTLKGNSKTIEATSAPVVYNGERMIQTIARDITEKKKQEKRREKLLDQLKIANTNLNEFARVISHDLKAPLRAIGSLSEWLMEDYDDKLDDEGREYLNLLVENVSRMDQLIDGVLFYSANVHSNDLDEPIDTKSRTQKVIALLQVPKHIEIVLQEDFPVIHFNRFQFGQIMQNLLSNAIKFMDKEKGHIIISVKERDDHWEFRVKDNGPGIDSEQDDIFQLFATSDDDKSSSTGIGLSIIKKILDNKHEKVWYENNESDGTTFFFTITKSGSNEKSEIDLTGGR